MKIKPYRKYVASYTDAYNKSLVLIINARNWKEANSDARRQQSYMGPLSSVRRLTR